jgi:transglutaminase-like putative cysteine protease
MDISGPAAWILFALATTAAAPPADDAWFRIENEAGDLVGWQHEQRIADAAGTRRTRETMMAYRVEGHEPTRSRFRVEQQRDSAGHLRSLTIESGDGRRSTVRRMTVEGGEAAVDDGKGHVLRRFALPAGLDFRDGDALLPIGEGAPAASFDIAPGDFHPVPTRTERTSIASLARTAVVAYQGDRVAHAWFVDLDAAGRIETADQPLFGTRLHFRRVTGPLTAADLAKIASLPHQMRASPYYVAPGALRGHIRYRFAPLPGVRIALPETGEQAVLEEEGALRVDICRTCGPGLSTDPADLNRWRRPSPWLQSDAPELVRAAAPVLKSTAPGADRMARLGRIARERLADVDYEGHHSALAAWQRGSGDCTEDAVVLAALARAAGIPARIANGLVYSRARYHGASNAFIAHSWVVAYVDGAWQSFDISTGAFDATHIALSIDDGDLASIVAANQTAALLEWREMAEVRKRPD